MITTTDEDNLKCINKLPECFAGKKPSFQIMLLTDTNQKFCSQKCRNQLFSHYMCEDIKQSFYLEQSYYECPLCICKDYFLVELSCGHKLCNNCMKKVFDSTTKCPICRNLILLKCENDNMSNIFRETVTSDHSYIIDTIYKLISCIDYQFDRETISSIHFCNTNRDISNDIEIIKEYFNIF